MIGLGLRALFNDSRGDVEATVTNMLDILQRLGIMGADCGCVAITIEGLNGG
jgi:hypothetical protein